MGKIDAYSINTTMQKQQVIYTYIYTVHNANTQKTHSNKHTWAHIFKYTHTHVGTI